MAVLRSFNFFLIIYALVAMEATVSKSLKGHKLMISTECSMLSMLPTTRNEGEEHSHEEAFAAFLKMGLRPREAAPEGRKQQEEEEEGHERPKWFSQSLSRSIVASQLCLAVPKVNKSRVLVPDGLVSSYQSKSVSSIGSLRPNGYTSVSFVASAPCNCKILEQPTSLLNKCIALRTLEVRSLICTDRTVRDNNVIALALPLPTMGVNGLALQAYT